MRADLICISLHALLHCQPVLRINPALLGCAKTATTGCQPASAAGGQILRNASALSAILARPIKVDRIRAGRDNPGEL